MGAAAKKEALNMENEVHCVPVEDVRFMDGKKSVAGNPDILSLILGYDNGNGKKEQRLSNEDKSLSAVIQPLGTGVSVYDSSEQELLYRPSANADPASLPRKDFSIDGSRPKIVAALAAYNEEEYIGTMVLATRSYVDGVIVVDDGSSDRTAKYAELAGARVLKHAANSGKGKAIQTILEEAKRIDVDILILIDADCQHNPDEIPLLIEPIKNGEADLVNGSRFLDKKSKIPLYRVIGQHIFTVLTNVFSGASVTDSQSGFRALSKKAINYMHLIENGMGVESEMIHKASEFNLVIKEVPISCRYDVNGSTLNPLVHGLSVISMIVNHLQRKHPLIYFGVPGMMLLIIGCVLSIQTFYAYTILGQFWIGKAMAAMLLLLMGVFAVFSGFILNSIAGMMNELKSKSG